MGRGYRYNVFLVCVYCIWLHVEAHPVLHVSESNKVQKFIKFVLLFERSRLEMSVILVKNCVKRIKDAVARRNFMLYGCE